MPADNPAIVALAPVPVVVTPSGLRVSVHVPVLGRSFKTTLPVETVQVGCVSVPTEGVLWVLVFGLITILPVGTDVQPDVFVMV